MLPNAFDYVAYDAQAKAEQAEAKLRMLQVEDLIALLGRRRVIYKCDIERSAAAVAYEKLQECYMWIGKQIRDNQIQRNGSAPLEENKVEVTE